VTDREVLVLCWVLWMQCTRPAVPVTLGVTQVCTLT
jgi:hypothetical protein